MKEALPFQEPQSTIRMKTQLGIKSFHKKAQIFWGLSWWCSNRVGSAVWISWFIAIVEQCLKWLENLRSIFELHRLHYLGSSGYLGVPTWTSRSVPELMEYVVWVPTCSSERLNREWMSASHIIPELRKLQTRLQVSFSELPRSRQLFLIESFQRGLLCSEGTFSSHLAWNDNVKSSQIKSNPSEQNNTWNTDGAVLGKWSWLC